ncbi:LOW QUALITY PROTEIN: hypothetical protein OSB04_019454 [Centaurea solstitialis]|uniref:Integrase catalytic domain-containing protein n=1 Tax=Centaurea solstitialis TaxID=347529 RepID=A0AA38T1W5_9ASTR|nr:LOW QUALITY PROTEIN: hypothetical protein OSB04_019454 [Centaurea solstitialis]
MFVQPPQDNNFYMDTGASGHMTFNQGTMHSLTPCNFNFVGNGDVVPTRYNGQCNLPFSPWPLLLKNVLENIVGYLFLYLLLKLLVCLTFFKYYVLLLDDFSHFLWVFPLRAKSEVFSVFKTFRAYVLNQFKTNSQLFQCDNGREFNNQPFLDFF